MRISRTSLLNQNNMQKLILLLLSIALSWGVSAQIVSTKKVENINVSTTTVRLLGKSDQLRNLATQNALSKEKKDIIKKNRITPDNFKGRRGRSLARRLEKEHQGPDLIRQTGFNNLNRRQVEIEPFVNIDGMGSGSPTDPTGDVSNEYYVQAVNATILAVYDLEGNLIQQLPMQTLWSQFNAISAGDPIVLFDEQTDQWIITEFTDPANLLIAVSETADPLGSFFAYSFSTPNFPDYPKYAITPRSIVVTTNEQGAGVLHQYFIDREALLAGENDVTMQRVAIEGSPNAEQGFIVSTPADWNGSNMPFDDKAITLKLNDSSWADGPDEDQIELYTFDIDFENQANTVVTQTSIVISPYDAYPCSVTGFGFACVPQQGGGGLDGVPEVIMNIPHLRNFGTHESLVFNFVTDVTDGQNLAGIRWVELRRTSADDEWTLYQEGTFSPDDGKDRFMGAIAMDKNGNIGLGYNVTSSEEFVGMRFTGRYATDPLGVMTIDEYEVVAGMGTINSGERFGDYSQMSVAPEGNTFWFTGEYAGNGNQVTESRIFAFELAKDSFDLAVTAIKEPITSSTLTTSELVTSTITNTGVNSIDNYSVSLIVDEQEIETLTLSQILDEGESLDVQFDTPIDMSSIGEYNVLVAVNTEVDFNSNNDTLRKVIRQIPSLEVELNATIETDVCSEDLEAILTLKNLGADNITNVIIAVEVNGVSMESLEYSTNILTDNTVELSAIISEQLLIGINNISFSILEVNGVSMDFNIDNNTATVTSNLLEDSNFITLVINTDQFAEETSWVISDVNTGLIYSEGSLTENLSNSEYREEICVPIDACFEIEMTDTYGDGICCDFGEGNFIILNFEGELLLFNDGDFGSGVTESFCQDPVECMLDADIIITDASDIGIADGIINISAFNAIEPYLYSIDGGQTTQEETIFQNVSSGDYNVRVIDATGVCIYDETITVGILSSVTNVNGVAVTLSVAPNPTEDIFKFELKNLPTSDNFVSVQILDVSGKLIQNRIVGRYDDAFLGTFSLMNYPDGIYFVRVLHPTANLLEKVIKQ